MEKKFFTILGISFLIGVIGMMNVCCSNKIDERTHACYHVSHDKAYADSIKAAEEKEYESFCANNTLKVVIFYSDFNVDTITLKPNRDYDKPYYGFGSRSGVFRMYDCEENLVLETNAPVKILCRPMDE